MLPKAFRFHKKKVVNDAACVVARSLFGEDWHEICKRNWNIHGVYCGMLELTVSEKNGMTHIRSYKDNKLNNPAADIPAKIIFVAGKPSCWFVGFYRDGEPINPENGMPQRVDYDAENKIIGGEYAIPFPPDMVGVGDTGIVSSQEIERQREMAKQRNIEALCTGESSIVALSHGINSKKPTPSEQKSGFC